MIFARQISERPVPSERIFYIYVSPQSFIFSRLIVTASDVQITAPSFIADFDFKIEIGQSKAAGVGSWQFSRPTSIVTADSTTVMVNGTRCLPNLNTIEISKGDILHFYYTSSYRRYACILA